MNTQQSLAVDVALAGTNTSLRRTEFRLRVKHHLSVHSLVLLVLPEHVYHSSAPGTPPRTAQIQKSDASYMLYHPMLAAYLDTFLRTHRAILPQARNGIQSWHTCVYERSCGSARLLFRRVQPDFLAHDALHFSVNAVPR